MNMLHSDRIEKILKENKFTKKYFRGVFPIDKISNKKILAPGIIIVNTDPSYLPGTHWFVIFIRAQNYPAEIFDSFGRKLRNNYIKRFVKINSNGKILYNNKQIQHEFSSMCGYYCCVYALYKSFGLSMKKFIDQFTNDYVKNDKLIRQLYDIYFKY